MAVNGNLPYPKMNKSGDWFLNMLKAILTWLILVQRVFAVLMVVKIIVLNPYLRLIKVNTANIIAKRIIESMLLFSFFEWKRIG